MTREEIIRNLKYTMEKHRNDWVPTFGTNIFVMCKDILDYLEREPCEDVVAIQTQGLNEGIRCAMCTNSLKNDRGCDGGCVVDENMYKEVMNTIRNHIVPSVTTIRKKGKWEFVGDNCFKCTECGEVYTVNQFKYIHNYRDNRLFPKGCPNCGAEMQEVEE